MCNGPPEISSSSPKNPPEKNHEFNQPTAEDIDLYYGYQNATT